MMHLHCIHGRYHAAYAAKDRLSQLPSPQTRLTHSSRMTVVSISPCRHGTSVLPRMISCGLSHCISHPGQVVV